MSDQEKRNRRISKRYIFGLSDKVWKDEPEPRKPSKSNGWGQLLETPGGFAEWLACDGRRGAIQRAHQRRRASEQAQAVAYANALAAAEEVSKDKADVQASKGKGTEAEKKENEQSNDWTEEEDKRLLDFKTENAKGQWSVISKELGKSDNACKNRFKDIKPPGWKPNVAKEKDDKDDKDGKATQKQGNSKKKQNEQKKEDTSAAPANSWDTATGGDGGGENTEWGGLGGLFEGDKDSKKSGSDKAKNDSAGNDDPWAAEGNGASWGMDDNKQKATGDSGDTGTAAWDTTGNDAWNATGNDEKTNGGNTWDSGAADWQNPGGGGQNDTKANEWGGISTEDKKDNDAPAPPAWDTPAQEPPATKADSAKDSKHGASKSRSSHRRRSHSKKVSDEESHVIELKPDDTFSTGDLQLIARILQKDAADVWQRVSWRFGDKTGRYNIDPDVFEKKITGHVEGKESSKGSRRRR